MHRKTENIDEIKFATILTTFFEFFKNIKSIEKKNLEFFEKIVKKKKNCQKKRIEVWQTLLYGIWIEFSRNEDCFEDLNEPKDKGHQK